MAQKHEEKSTPKIGPTPYGSHAQMEEKSESELVDKKFAVLKDEVGLYVTERHNLDSGLADPYRYADKDWRDKQLQKVKNESR